MTEFEAPDPHFADRIRDSFGRKDFMKFIGARLTDVGPGTCEISVHYRDDLSQQHDYFHGGVIGAIADNAAGYASYTLMGVDDSILTVEYKLNIMAPGQGETLVSRAQVIKPGRTLSVSRSDVFAIKGGEETLCATAQVTLMRLAGRADTPSAG
jgi:uncharacterized protein (TIGR00369 family)